MIDLTHAANNNWKNITSVHPDLVLSRDLVFNPCGFRCSEPIAERESAEYGAYNLNLFRTKQNLISFIS